MAENPFPGLYRSCPEHDWEPPRGPAGSSAKALCPGCTNARDLASGRMELSEAGIPRPRTPGRVVREGGLVSDGPLVGERMMPTAYADRLWGEFLSQQEDRRRAEGQALYEIEQSRARRQRRPRQRRPQFSKYEDGRWQNFYGPERRPPVEFDLEDD